MVKKRYAKKKQKKRTQEAPGVSLEKVVARIQQMMDPDSTVTHNEKLKDRVGIERQYDVVIRGHFGGRPVLGVMECKDHSRKKGPDAVEAFAKKAENLNANLKLLVSKKGFTDRALVLAKHEGIGCLSLLPDDPKQMDFSIGDMWYGVIRLWADMRLMINFAVGPPPMATFDSATVKWNGKLVSNWFAKELYTTYSEMTKEGDYLLELKFDGYRNIEIEAQEYSVLSIACAAKRVCRKKKKWVNWSGDAFYDWQTHQLTIPNNGRVVGSAVETDLSAWPDCDGEIPDLTDDAFPGFLRAILYNTQKWDNNKDSEVPDLHSLCTEPQLIFSSF